MLHARQYNIDDGKNTFLCNCITVEYSLLIFNLFYIYIFIGW